MTELQQNIISDFHALLKEHEMDCTYQNFVHAKRKYDIYSVVYSDVIADFIVGFTGIKKSHIQQFVTAQQFFFLLSDNPVIDIKVCLVVSDNLISIEFKETVDVQFELDNPAFLNVLINKDDIIRIVDENHVSLLDPTSFEVAYKSVLNDIDKVVDSTMLSFNQVLALSRRDTLDVLNERLSFHQIKAISPLQFCSTYLNNPDLEHKYESYINLPEQVFMTFLKDNFPPILYSKIRSILSVSMFQEKLCKRSLDWHTLTDLNIKFPDVSKYSDVNCIYEIIFSVMPNDAYRCTLYVYDDGTFSFYYDLNNELKQLTSLDDIYDYIKDGFITHIEKTLDVNRKDIKTSHLKIYEMVLA